MISSDQNSRRAASFATGAGERPTRRRYRALALIFGCVLVNYMDRANIAMAGPALREELGLSHVQLGLIFSAFGWSYCALQVPGGALVDLVPVRRLYPVLIALWSVATFGLGWATTVGAFVVGRLLVGIFEAPSYPCNTRMVTAWFPVRERASAISVYTSGQFLGIAALSPCLFALQAAVGWRGLFIATGAIGLVWAVVMARSYRDPVEDPRLNAAERATIADGGGSVRAHREGPRLQWRDVATALSYRQLWGVYLGQFCLGAAFQFFLTWFPTYLRESRGLSLLSTGYWGSVPYLGAFAGVLLAGFLSDHLVRRGWAPALARKLPVLAGMLLMTVIVGANYTASLPLVIACMTVAFFGNGLASIGWVFVSSMAPLRLLGLVGGIFNFFGTLSGATMPAVLGWLSRHGDFRPALLFVAVMSAIGFASYLFLVGRVERLPDPRGEVPASPVKPA